MLGVKKAHETIKDIFLYYGSDFVLRSLAKCVRESLNKFVLSKEERYRAKKSNVEYFIRELNK